MSNQTICLFGAGITLLQRHVDIPDAYINGLIAGALLFLCTCVVVIIVGAPSGALPFRIFFTL